MTEAEHPAQLVRRQVGTLVEECVRDFRPRPMFIDEIQRAGNDFALAIKAAVDRDPRPGTFVLSGSTRFLTVPTLSESLAGRAALIEFWPFSVAAHVLGSMANQCQGRPTEAVTLIDTAVAGTRGQQTPRLLAELHIRHAYAFAALKDTSACTAATSQARTHVEQSAKDNDPPYLYWVSPAEITTGAGYGLLQLTVEAIRQASDGAGVLGAGKGVCGGAGMRVTGRVAVQVAEDERLVSCYAC